MLCADRIASCAFSVKRLMSIPSILLPETDEKWLNQDKPRLSGHAQFNQPLGVLERLRGERVAGKHPADFTRTGRGIELLQDRHRSSFRLALFDAVMVVGK